jgi:glycosyltransferase involved in cell wall biosynthesis
MKNKITILVFSLGHGGAEKVCLSLCNEFVKREFEVELWIADFKETALTKKLDNRITVFPMHKSRARSTVVPLTKLLLERKPERMLIFHIELAILMIILKKLFLLNTFLIARSINTLSEAFKYPNGIWEKYVAKKAISFFLPHADRIIAQSTGMRDDLIKFFGIAEDKVVMIPNPVEISANGLYSENGSTHKNEFLFVGRLNPQKGLTNMLMAFSMVSREADGMHLTLVGDGPEMEHLKNLAKELNIHDKVSFEGYQANTEIYYRRAKATLLTSFFEGFPNVLVESIALGTPVISFDCPSGPADIIIPGVNGILVPHQDIQEFSKALAAVAKNEIKFDMQEVIESSNRFSTGLVTNKYEQACFKQS